MSEVWNIEQALEATLGREDLLAQVIKAFLDDSVSLIQRLHDSHREADWEQVRFFAHSLKGSCANVSAVQLSEHARKIEFAVKAKDYLLVDRLLTEIMTLMNALESRIQVFLSRLD